MQQVKNFSLKTHPKKVQTEVEIKPGSLTLQVQSLTHSQKCSQITS